MKFFGKVGNGASEQLIKFWWQSGSPLGTGIVFRIRHYWEIRKVVNGHSFIYTDSADTEYLSLGQRSFVRKLSY